MASIFGSVGSGGINREADVRAVQELLNRHISRLGLAPLRVDGTVGRITAEAIRRFQTMIMGLVMPDGRIDPQGRTVNALDGGVTGGSSPNLVATATGGSPAANGPQAQSTEKAKLDIDAAVKWLGDNASATSQGKCARSVRLAIEKGGITIKNNPLYAKDYGPFLVKYGFVEMAGGEDYAPLKGDIAVIQPYTGGHPAGHITMYDGSTWLSDFRQRDMWSGPGYRKQKPSFAIYRP